MPEDHGKELAEIWESVREDLRRSVPASAFETWLEPVRAVGIQGTRFYVAGPDRVRDWFERRYEGLAMSALQQRIPALTEIVFADAKDDASDSETGAGRSSIPAGLERNLSFDRFVIGRGNRFAHSAALAVAELPGDAYNPLFIYGEPGLGKTHLLVSIANYLQRQRPDMTVVYTTAERFTSEFVTSVKDKRGGRSAAFKQRYRDCGALLIDDIQFLEGKERTEEEFFHTFNELYAAGSQIVLSSDRPPEAIERLSTRLRDRFAWGLTVEVQAPDLSTRVALLRRLAAEKAFVLPDIDVLQQIASSVPPNLRQLEGALTRVAAFSSLLGESPSPDLVEEALRPGNGAERIEVSRAPMDIDAIKQATCDVLRVSMADLTSKRRTTNVVRARQLAMYVARNSTGASLAEIARAFDRDHSTVLHAIRAIDKKLVPGSDIHRVLETIHERLHIDAESD